VSAVTFRSIIASICHIDSSAATAADAALLTSSVHAGIGAQNLLDALHARLAPRSATTTSIERPVALVRPCKLIEPIRLRATRISHGRAGRGRSRRPADAGGSPGDEGGALVCCVVIYFIHLEATPCRPA